MVGHADRLADVVAEAGDHNLVVRAGALGTRRRLEAMGELVDGEAVGDVAERLEHAQHPVGDTTLVLERLGADDRPLVGGGLVHPAEALRSRLRVCLRHDAILP